MGTRSKIIVSSKKENLTVVLYKHWDGYPSENLKMLHTAFSGSKDIEGFKNVCAGYYERDNMEEMRTTFNPKIIFNADYPLQGDLEYFYMVDLDAKNIDIFGQDYGNEREHYTAGKIHPMKEVDGYKDEYKLPTKKKISEILGDLNLLGISINGGESDDKLVLEQLNNVKKKQRELENTLYDLRNENDNNKLNISYLTKTYFKVMTAKQLKEFLEVSGLEVLKVTKRKTYGAFNVYLGENKDFKDGQYRTPWQHVRWLSHVLDLDIEVK